MMRTTVRTLLANIAVAAAAPVAAQSIPSLDHAMAELVDKGEFVGIATEVWKDGKLVDRHAAGSRDGATRAPMTPDTIVRAFSMTKPVTGVALMILHDQGKWDFDDPVSKFLPELAAPRVFMGLGAAGKPILAPARGEPTMAQLVSQTAGYSYGFDPGWVDDQYRAADLWSSRDSKDFVDRIAKIPLAYQPGTRWHYAVGMDLEGAIVERLSGMSLAAFMRQHIFQPLGMNDTDFHVPASKLDRLATVYETVDGKLVPAKHLLLNNDPAEVSGFNPGGAGLYTTADDYSRFARMLLGRGTLDGHRIVSAAAVDAMTTNRVPTDVLKGDYGIGVHRIRPGYEYGVNGVVVTDPREAGVALGKGTYLWDGLASTWFWVDPSHRITFVGMVQRVAGLNVPLIQTIAQRAIAQTFYPDEASPTRTPTRR